MTAGDRDDAAGLDAYITAQLDLASARLASDPATRARLDAVLRPPGQDPGHDETAAASSS